ncbi:hypothetical protein ON010_g3452 [Phytophthora cinnamomi]|nr:hypothetical protein ON010_g3452 [Phytophthora cinnamomi]
MDRRLFAQQKNAASTPPIYTPPSSEPRSDDSISGYAGNGESNFDGDFDFGFGNVDEEVSRTEEPQPPEGGTDIGDRTSTAGSRTGRTNRWIGGYKYTRANKLQNKIFYRCNGEINLTPSITEYVTLPMKREVDLAITMTASRSATWNAVRAKFYGSRDQTVVHIGLTREYVLRRVNRVRAEEFGGSVYDQIEVPP